MDYIQYILRVIMVIVMVIAVTKIYMIIAAYIGGKLGIGKFFIFLWERMRR
ncbi:hypothetical protein [Alkaliphilus peptidifermentans]|uniref:Uncharacterized protein n=1 Tax=Alkaliphilus peptidifermentans DSM 18978 TaxID=1120976 RepID=A0A1G5IUG5_9FIRM|nr:hypothetical protein [Alkaliphilus peptidifermentans]SCY79371.1 hypothetical protein SAMN03080606_02512 [Alkaliphilus peptidifermentans DSM 18978]